ncbi:MAG: HEPN domain-containing protein [Chloroflexi bacterium]|nr:HEPN domain-containing protein [Chloroflexota bacterium]
MSELVTRLRTKFRKQLVRVILFGSKVRGDFDAESDVDVLIVFKPNGAITKETIYDQERAVADKYNVLLGAVAVEYEDFQAFQKLRAPLYRNLRNEGYSLYPRQGKYSRASLPVNGGVENVDKNKKIQIKHFIERARQALADAQADLERGSIAAAANRAYYTVYYLATAVLFVLDVVRAKHEGVISAFGEYMVKTKRIEPEYSKILVRAFKLRVDADYAEEWKLLNPESAKQIVADAEKFVARMEEYLREVGALDEDAAKK